MTETDDLAKRRAERQRQERGGEPACCTVCGVATDDVRRYQLAADCELLWSVLLCAAHGGRLELRLGAVVGTLVRDLKDIFRD
jgi:hypothetical protein